MPRSGTRHRFFPSSSSCAGEYLQSRELSTILFAPDAHRPIIANGFGITIPNYIFSPLGNASWIAAAFFIPPLIRREQWRVSRVGISGLTRGRDLSSKREWRGFFFSNGAWKMKFWYFGLGWVLVRLFMGYWTFVGEITRRIGFRWLCMFSLYVCGSVRFCDS